MDEADHLKAIDEAPRDRVRRLAYAEWLERRGDQRAELLRLEEALKHEPLGSPSRRACGRRWRKLRAALDPDWVARVRSDAVVPPWFSTGAQRLERTGVVDFCEWMGGNHWEWVSLAVMAPLELVAPVLIESRCLSRPERLQAQHRWRQNVPVRAGQKYESVSGFVPLVQMRGHAWTFALYATFRYSWAAEFSAAEDARELSHHFGTVAISFASEDTSGATGYHLYQCGDLAESAEWSAGEGRFASHDHSRPTWSQFPPDYPDALFRELELYIPPCYAGQDPALAVDGLPADEVARADFIDLSAGFRVPEPSVGPAGQWPFAKIHVFGELFDLSELTQPFGREGDSPEMPF